MSLAALVATAAFLGVVHTITGPDHYIPFVAMSRARRWSLKKTIVVTLGCGMGHVLSSVAFGMVGIAAGLAVGRLEALEGKRGGLAGWLLLGFGLTYLAWGVWRAIRNQPHSHAHVHAGGATHEHEHGHTDQHAHAHAEDEGAASLTPWVLFAIFVFGPCEPLIPILMYPAAKLSLWGVVLVTLVFAACTLATMSAVVAAGFFGSSRLSWTGLARYGHAVAGLAIAVCGAAVQLGL
jgi:ABC-type nickel/cobalt efflux system permease component RcnA